MRFAFCPSFPNIETNQTIAVKQRNEPLLKTNPPSPQKSHPANGQPWTTFGGLHKFSRKSKVHFFFMVRNGWVRNNSLPLVKGFYLFILHTYIQHFPLVADLVPGSGSNPEEVGCGSEGSDGRNYWFFGDYAWLYYPVKWQIQDTIIYI